MAHAAGDLVWAKMAGYPHWPAMVMDAADVPVPIPPASQPVLFFGTNETGFIKSAQLLPYLQNRAAYEKPKKVAGHLRAIREIRLEAGLAVSDLPDEEEGERKSRAADASDFAKALGKRRFPSGRRGKRKAGGGGDSPIGRKRRSSRSHPTPILGQDVSLPTEAKLSFDAMDGFIGDDEQSQADSSMDTDEAMMAAIGGQVTRRRRELSGGGLMAELPILPPSLLKEAGLGGGRRRGESESSTVEGGWGRRGAEASSSAETLLTVSSNDIHEEELKESFLLEFQSSVHAANTAKKNKQTIKSKKIGGKPKQKLKVAIGTKSKRAAEKASAASCSTSSSSKSAEGDGGGLTICGECGSGIRPETGGAVGTYRLRCSNKACRKWWGLVDRNKWMEMSNYTPKRMKDIHLLRAAAKKPAKKASRQSPKGGGKPVSSMGDELGGFDVTRVSPEDALDSFQALMDMEEGLSSPTHDDRRAKKVSFEPGGPAALSPPHSATSSPGNNSELFMDGDLQKRCATCGFLVRPFYGGGDAHISYWRCLSKACLRWFGVVEDSSDVVDYKRCGECGGEQRLKPCGDVEPSEMRYQCLSCGHLGEYILPHPKCQWSRGRERSESGGGWDSDAVPARPSLRKPPSQRARKSITAGSEDTSPSGGRRRRLVEAAAFETQLSSGKAGGGSRRRRSSGAAEWAEEDGLGRSPSSPLPPGACEWRPGLVETKGRWWLRNRRGKRALSPPRELGSGVMEAAAVFRIVGQTLEGLGERLRREADLSAGAADGALDLLLDSLLSTLPRLLSLTSLIPQLNHLTPRTLDPLIENTTPIIPMFNS